MCREPTLICAPFCKLPCAFPQLLAPQYAELLQAATSGSKTLAERMSHHPAFASFLLKREKQAIKADFPPRYDPGNDKGDALVGHRASARSSSCSVQGTSAQCGRRNSSWFGREAAQYDPMLWTSRLVALGYWIV